MSAPFRDGARPPPSDGALQAIVAADRLALSETSEGKELLQRRLSVFYGYFALLSTLGAFSGITERLLVGVDPGAVGFVVNVQRVHALALCAIFGALRLGVQGMGWMRALDVCATAATSVTAAVALSAVPYVLTADVTTVSFYILFFSLRAALVPSNPWLLTLVAAASAVPFTIGLWNMYRRALVPDPTEAAFNALRAMLGGIAGVYVVSRTIYGLRRAVERVVQLGQYVVHEKIGEGGMGAVYRASHAMLKRPTAVKLIAPGRGGEGATARFEREVMAASRLTHPNNVAIYDFGRTRGGVFYYAMELLDGQNLASLVEREGPQPVSRTLRILRQLVAALGEAHDMGLVHRDVKPENVMLCTRGGVRDFVKVLDFGLVKDVSPEATPITAETTIAGTPLYMAPEVILTPQAVGPPADIYASGCVAYFLLTGRPPFPGNNLVQVCAAHLHTLPSPPSSHVFVPSELDALVVCCLEKDASRRPTTRELGEQLAAIGGGASDDGI
jgi:eukaryotic-like serine/threonine-protein kinase